MLALNIQKRMMNWSAILVILTGACTTNPRGFRFEEQVLADASAVTREHLRSRARTASADSAGGARMVAAAEAYSSPKLLVLEPCHTEVRFSYRYDGQENHGAADLDYDRTRRSWVLRRLWVIHEE
ncbi:MAG TPA: hypothetical protein VF584_01340 [Longimicrobium sp.]|jgi:hypothetical protein